MATINASNTQTLVDLTNQIDPGGNLMVIAEVLDEDNPILQDAPWVEANAVFNHMILRRLSVGTGTWRKLNKGVPVSATHTKKVIETIGMLEDYAECDKFLADTAPNPEQFRMNNARGILEGMSQTAAAAAIYGNAALDPEKITGLAPRMASLAATTNVIGQGGTGSDCTSIYIVQWGETRVHMVYPKASTSVGLSHKDLGEVTLQDSDSNNYQGYRDHFQMQMGMVVQDEKCIARLANIESAGTSNLIDEDNLITLLNRMRGSGAGSMLYMNATVKTQMEIKLKDKHNVNLSVADGLGGVPILRFRGNPVRKVDQILDTETAIT